MMASMANGAPDINGQAEAGPSRLRADDAVAPNADGLPPSTDPRNLRTPASARRAIAELDAYSERLDAALSDAIEASLTRIGTSQKSIAALAPQVQLLAEEAGVLRGRLSEAARTSDRISGAVKVLDERRRRVRVAAAWVQWAQDLKASLASLASAIEQGNWELAIKYTQKAMATPQEVIESEFANRVVPSSEQPLEPAQTLLELRTKMLKTFTQRFKSATESKDQAEASRFFRMFPLIGWRSEGLEVYCDFAKGMIRERGQAIIEAAGRASAPPLHHAQLLTALFEQLAMLIDTHQAVVDRHYGKGNFAAGVMPGLQDECDRIGIRIVENWMDKTQIIRRLDESKAFTFTFLTNLGSQGGSSMKRNASRASANTWGGRPGTPLDGGRPETPSRSFDETQPPDGREIDRLLAELATMSARWATYQRFLMDRFEARPIIDAKQSGNGEDGELKDFRRGSMDSSRRGSVSGLAPLNSEPVEIVSADQILEASMLGQKLEDLLKDVYCPLERWYLRSSLEKAHLIDSPDFSARPLTSSILDDAFFLLRSVLTRIISTSHLTTITTCLASYRTIADEDYIQVLVRRMEMTWRNVAGALSGPDGPRKENATREMRSQFILYLNVLSTSSIYAERILGDLSSFHHLDPLFGSEEEVIQVVGKLESLGSFPSRLRSATKTEMEHLFTQTTRPRLRQLLNDCYKGVSYDLTEADFTESEYQDLFFRRFTRGFEAIALTHFKAFFNEACFEDFFSLCVENIVRPWERLILTGSISGSDIRTGPAGGSSGMQFTEWGAMRFDKDWRSVANWLSAQTTSGEIRDKFARLQQIAYVLSLDETEAEDDDVVVRGGLAANATAATKGRGGITGQDEGQEQADDAALEEEEQEGDEGIYKGAAASGFSWRLSANEVKAARRLRVI